MSNPFEAYRFVPPAIAAKDKAPKDKDKATTIQVKEKEASRVVAAVL